MCDLISAKMIACKMLCHLSLDFLQFEIIEKVSH